MINAVTAAALAESANRHGRDPVVVKLINQTMLLDSARVDLLFALAAETVRGDQRWVQDLGSQLLLLAHFPAVRSAGHRQQVGHALLSSKRTQGVVANLPLDDLLNEYKSVAVRRRPQP